ncbi:hypothetical protein [Streptomyces albogriseolus]|uniref:hypothetical protein n=1 Tax=Streptomyces albogriseolus TaxID=1887 RepID=UPI003CEE22C0
MSDERSSVPQAGLLAQMDLLMAALNADLSALDAELLDSGGRGEAPGASGGGYAAEARACAAEDSGDGPAT